MVYWFYNRRDLKATPSAQDGVLQDTEMRYRKEGARFIMDLGNKIGLRYDTVATGVVFMHRFYMFHSFKEFDRYVTACCCLFLAGKVEETPKKCKDIIKVAKALLPDTKFTAFGSDPKEEVMTMERILLQTIKFDLQVDHPYTYLIKYAKCLKGDKAKLHKCVQMAWTFVNDSLCTTLSLQWEPEIIAIALMYLAGKLSKFEVVDWVGRQPHHLRWWDMFVEDISMELLEDICHQVLDLYQQPKVAGVAAESPPQTAPAPAAAASAAPVAAATKQEPQAADVASLAPASAELTPKKELRKAAPSTPPAQPKTEPPSPAAAAPAAAQPPATGGGAAGAAGGQFGGFGFGPPPGGAYGYMYPPHGGGSAPPPPPPPPPAAGGSGAASFPPQYPPYGFPSGPSDSKAPPPPPGSKYPPPPPPGGSVPPPPPPGGAPPLPPPLHHAPYPSGPSGGPPARGFFPPQGGPPPGFRPPGPGFPPGHRPF